jgi:hypothetical protein
MTKIMSGYLNCKHFTQIKGDTMKLYTSIPYTFEEKDFEIRIYYDEACINVVAFLSGHPANGYRFQAKIPKQCDAEKVLEKYPVPDLVEMCKDTIKEKKWEHLSQVVNEATSIR